LGEIVEHHGGNYSRARRFFAKGGAV